MSGTQEQHDTPPSVATVEAALAAKRAELVDAERQCSDAEAAMDAAMVVSATQRAGVLRRFIGTLEGQLVEACEREARREAAQRLVGIRRAHGSLVASLGDDEQRVREAASALADAIQRMNDRYHQLARLRMEAGALCDRFALKGAELPRVLPPALRNVPITPSVELADYARPRPAVEKDATGLRERRTYDEVRGSDGYTIIARVGPKPWPPLTERQERSVAQRERDAATSARSLAPVLAMAAEIAALPAKLSAEHVSVRRG